MNPVGLAALNYLLNSIWQIPLSFLAATLSARLARPIGPRAQHRVWVAALFAELLLPLGQFNALALWNEIATLAARLLQWNQQSASPRGQVSIQLGAMTARSSSWLHLPPAAQAPTLIAYLAVCLYFAIRLALGIRSTRRLAHSFRPIHPSSKQRTSLRGLSSPGPVPVSIAISPDISSPVTIGFRHPMLLLPTGFLDRVAPVDLDAVLEHELAHIHRRDFAKNLFYGLISIPAAYHRVLWLTFARIAETREMICDEIAADSLACQSPGTPSVAGRERYARSLLQLASLLALPSQPSPLHSIGIFDANTLERRIMNLTRKSAPIRRSRKLTITLACTMLAASTCASTLAIHLDAATPTVQPIAQSDTTKRVSVKQETMKLVKKANPVYPLEAKKNKDTIDGTVTLEAIIGKEGAIENLRIKKSLRNDYDQSALDAVRQWVYEPFLLNGDPVEVETTINVTFAIAP